MALADLTETFLRDLSLNDPPTYDHALKAGRFAGEEN